MKLCGAPGGDVRSPTKIRCGLDFYLNGRKIERFYVSLLIQARRFHYYQNLIWETILILKNGPTTKLLNICSRIGSARISYLIVRLMINHIKQVIQRISKDQLQIYHIIVSLSAIPIVSTRYFLISLLRQSFSFKRVTSRSVLNWKVENVERV